MTKIMGIINVTPDSFSGDGIMDIDDILKKADFFLNNGADILDVGGESTRPSSTSVSEEEEIQRVIPAIKAIKEHFPKTVLSVDTTKRGVALRALDLGVNIINDIKGDLIDIEHNSPFDIVVMSYRSHENAKFMGAKGVFDDLQKRLEKIKIDKNRIIIDPGIGFGKTHEGNIDILKNIKEFKKMGYRVLVAASNKSFIGGDVEDRTPETLVSSVWSALHNIDIIRVHDVRQTFKALKFLSLLKPFY